MVTPSEAIEYLPRRVVEFGEMPTDMRQDIINEVGHTEFFRAIGYLSTWNQTYPKVLITMWRPNDWPPEIGAAYYDATGKVGYVISAVFNRETKQFGFHS